MAPSPKVEGPADDGKRSAALGVLLTCVYPIGEASGEGMAPRSSFSGGLTDYSAGLFSVFFRAFFSRWFLEGVL